MHGRAGGDGQRGFGRWQRERGGPADGDRATGCEDRTENRNRLPGQGNRRARLHGDPGSASEHEIAADFQLVGGERVVRAQRPQGETDRFPQPIRFEETTDLQSRIAPLVGHREQALRARLDDGPRRHEQTGNVGFGIPRSGKSRRVHPDSIQCVFGESTPLEEIRLEHECAGETRPPADLDELRLQGQAAAGRAGVAGKLRAEQNPPARDIGHGDVAPAEDGDRATIAVGDTLAGGMQSAGDIDGTAGRKQRVEGGDGNAPALDDQRVLEHGRASGTIIDNQSGRAQAAAAAEREDAASRHGSRQQGAGGIEDGELRREGRRDVVGGERKIATRRGDGTGDGDVGGLEVHLTERRCLEMNARGNTDIPIRVAHLEFPEAIVIEQRGWEENLRDPIGGQGRGRPAREIKGGHRTSPFRAENHIGRKRRIGEKAEIGGADVESFLALEGDGQRGWIRQAVALARSGNGAAAQDSIERHGRGLEAEVAAIGPGDVGAFVMRLADERDGEGLGHAPSGMNLVAFAREDAAVNAVGGGLFDGNDLAEIGEPGCFHHARLVHVGAAGNIKHRTGLRDDGAAGRERDISAARRELGGVTFDQSGQSGRITEGRANPETTVEDPRAPDVHRQWNAAQDAAALQNRVGEFRAAQFDIENAVGQRHEDIRAAGNIDHGLAADMDLPAGKEEPLFASGQLVGDAGFDIAIGIENGPVAVGVGVRPGPGAGVHEPVRGEDGRAVAEMNDRAFHVEARAFRQGGAGHGLGAGIIRKNGHHAARPGGHETGVLVKERRTAATDRAGIVVVRVSDRTVTGDQVDASVEIDGGRAADGPELFNPASGHQRAAGRHFDQTAVGHRAAIGSDIAHPYVQPAQTRIRAVMGGDADLQTRRENRLSGFGRDVAFIGHVRRNQHHPATAAALARRRGEFRSRQDADVAEAPEGDRRSRWSERRRAIRAAGHRQTGEKELRVPVV